MVSVPKQSNVVGWSGDTRHMSTHCHPEVLIADEDIWVTTIYILFYFNSCPYCVVVLLILLISTEYRGFESCLPSELKIY